jgi:sugar/nucleoside kinase (ribokinase family)
MTMNAKQAVAFGNIMLDYICDLTTMPLAEFCRNLESNTTIFSPIAIKPGGDGLLFAIAAKEVGFAPSTLIGKIGGRIDKNELLLPDLPGSMIIEFLNQSGIVPLLALAPNIETGHVFLNYYASDWRLMISDPLANKTFSPEDISTEIDGIIRQADLFFVSGYMLLTSTSRAAAIMLMSRAKSHGGRIVVDLVPHTFYKHMSLKELRKCIGHLVDWVFMTVPLAHQLLGLGHLDHDKTQLMVDSLLQTIVADLPATIFQLSPDHHHLVYWDGTQRCDYFSARQGQADSRARGLTSFIQAEFIMEQLKTESE